MQTQFTPWVSLLGGGLIGLSAVWLLLTTGRIAGVSGIVSKLLPPTPGKQGMRIGFVLGLLLAVPVYNLLTGGYPTQTVSANFPLLAVAGLLVGFGSVLGNGCTSGHGVCGISRLSSRSLVATCTFMATAFITVFILRHVVGG